MQTARQLLMLEMNEVNFEVVARHAERGELPAFADFFNRYGFVSTTSEPDYKDLEPWIQWVTAHTGLTRAEHGVFRLGDIVDFNHEQVWERLENMGFSVGAISPMNAKMRLKRPAFFVPDPWTPTAIAAPRVIKRMVLAIAQAVNDNASARITPRSLVDLAIGGALTARPGNYRRYLADLVSARRKPWTRALFLDRLLADLFSRCVERTRPDFATLFLNAGAHIQHHYMFSSALYAGKLRNPEWYVARADDPQLEVYRLYDEILSDTVRRFPSARIMLATGLHQDPHDEVTHYWRLRDHERFLRVVGLHSSRSNQRCLAIS